MELFVRTQFTDLDAVTGGLAPGSLWVISGRSGAGKSVLVSDLVRSAAVRHGRPTLLITRREPAVHVARPLLIGPGGVFTIKCERGRTVGRVLTPEEVEGPVRETGRATSRVLPVKGAWPFAERSDRRQDRPCHHRR